MVCADEALLRAGAICRPPGLVRVARVASTEKRLAALPPDYATVLVNDYPLSCATTRCCRAFRDFRHGAGTRLTEGWRLSIHAASVIYGHLHVRNHFEQDGVAFHEVSLGYPGQWKDAIDPYLRLILSDAGRLAVYMPTIPVA